MAGLCTIVYTMMLLTLYSVDVQANITLPSFGNITYVPKGSNVTLQWSYDFGAAIIGSTEWFFSNLGKPREFLAVIVGSTVTKSTSSSLTNINVITPATLVLINVSLDYNGTYRFKLSVISIDPAPFSEVLVVVLAQPTAVINGCPSPYTVEEGKDITCLCSGTGGNPPATASWWKNGMVVNGTGYLKKNLILKNISREDTGIYNCTVRSHNLTDATSVNITLRVKYKPTNISFSSNHSHNVVTSGKSVEIICKADAYPEATYSISYNGSLLTDAVNGSYTISSVNGSHGGNYTCVAKNAIGNVSAQFFLKVNEIHVPGEKDKKVTGGIKWYIVFIAVIGGICGGAIICYAGVRLYRRWKENETHPKPSEARRVSETQENPSGYQELDLQRRNNEDNYQSLKEDSKAC